MVLRNKVDTVMSEDTSAAIPASSSTDDGLRKTAVFAVLTVLILFCYYPMLLETGSVIVFGDDMAHGLFAPFVALYVAWINRSSLLNPVSPSSFWSLAFVGFAACIGFVSTLANSSTFSRFAFLITLAGCILAIGGWRALRRMAFPLGLLLFTFPVPDVLYGEITQPLQMLATRLSESAFELLGFSVLRDGNILQLTYMSLSVVEACSGLRSLITLVFFSVVYGYVFETRLWLRVGIVLLAVPAAIGVNALRITATGVLGKYNPAWAQGTYHEIVGWAACALGFALVLAGHQLARLASGEKSREQTA
jgi:exosortase